MTEQPRGDEVGDEADDGDDDQADRADIRFRMAEALHGLEGDEDGDAEQGEAVDGCRDHLGAMEAEGPLHVVWTRGDAHGEERQGERRDVAGDMAEVGEQCERVREQATDKLEDGGGEDEHERGGEPATLRGVGVVVGCGHAIERTSRRISTSRYLVSTRRGIDCACLRVTQRHPLRCRCEG